MAFAGLAALLVCLAPRPALAEELDIEPIPSEFQLEVERTAVAYDEAVAEADKAAAALEENAEKVAELEALLPEQQRRSEEAAREMYKVQHQSSGLIDLVLASETFDDFVKQLDYANRVAEANVAEVTKLREMKAELDDTQSQLEQAKEDADAQTQAAADALEAAQAARMEAQRKAEEEARQRAEAKAAAEAAAAAAAAAAEEEARRAEEEAAEASETDDGADEDKPADEAEADGADDAESGDEGGSSSDAEGEKRSDESAGETEAEPDDAADAEAADDTEADAETEADSADDAESGDEGENGEDSGDETTGSDENAEETAAASDEAAAEISDGADWSSDQQAFIDEWTRRIDAYLEGSELAGQGKSFAKAAWDYGVDPRWSPAIAFTESGLGAACFLPHNAWGWGSASWGSWEEAIDEHVQGLARGYGYTISMENAQKYCPPNSQFWYDTTLGQMNLI